MQKKLVEFTCRKYPSEFEISKKNHNTCLYLKGAPLGAGETAQYLATYDRNAPPGAVLAKVLIKDGKAQPYTPAQVV